MGRAKAAVISKKENSDADLGYKSRIDAKHEARLAAFEKRKDMDRAEKLANNKEYIRNHTVPVLMREYPHDPKLWHVSRFFMAAEGGPLYVDEVMNDHMLPFAMKKHDAMVKHGLRHVVLTNDMSTLQDIEALEACGQQHKKPETN